MPAARASQMREVGVGFCILAIAIVLIDAIYLDRFRYLPSWPTLTAGAMAWALLVRPAAYRRRLAEDSIALERWCLGTIFAAFLALYAVSSFPGTFYNEQVRQAVAFLH